MMRTMTILLAVLLVCMCGAASAEGVLKAHWTFDGFTTGTPLTDVTGNAPASTFISPDIYTTAGAAATTDFNFGDAIIFDGYMPILSNKMSYITIPDDPDLDIDAGDFTVSFMIKADNSAAMQTNRDATVFAKGANTSPAQNQIYYRMKHQDGQLHMELRDGSTSAATRPSGWVADQWNAKKLLKSTGTSSTPTVQGSSPMFDGTWHHVAFTRKALTADPQSTRTLSFYVDGTLNSSWLTGYTLDQTANVTNPESLYLGWWGWGASSDPLVSPGSGRKHAGPKVCFDDLRIYSGAMTVSELRAIYVAPRTDPASAQRWEMFD